MLDLFHHQWREVALGAGAATAVLAFYGMGATFLINYGVADLGLPRRSVLIAAAVGGAVFGLTTVLGSFWSDRIGRRCVVLLGGALAIGVALVLFPILDLATPLAFGVGLALTFGVTGLGYGPLGAQLAEIFPTRYRYTGAGVAYNIAGVLGAAATPIIAAPLLAGAASLAVGVLLAVIAVLSYLCVLAIPETRDTALGDTESDPALSTNDRTLEETHAHR